MTDTGEPGGWYVAHAVEQRRQIRLDYYLELTREVWGSMPPHKRRRLLRRDPLVYSILKGLAD